MKITEYGKNCLEINHETLIPRWAILHIYPEINRETKEKEIWVCANEDQFNIPATEYEKLKDWMNDWEQERKKTKAQGLNDEQVERWIDSYKIVKK